jgi:hypothetical protein
MVKKSSERLITILRRVEMTHFQHPITPARKDGYIERASGMAIDSNQTGWEFGNRPIRDKNRGILGDFYEFMTAGIYGGIIRQNICTTSSAYVEPDVLNKETRQGFESKACHCSELLKLNDHQVQRYQGLQFLMQDYSFYFAVYKHSLTGLNDYEEETLFLGLSDKTLCSVVIPLSLVLDMHCTRDENLVYRYDGDKWYPNTAIRSRTLNKFFGDLRKGSESEIVREIGANPKDYTFRRLMSPINFFIKGNRIKPFPVMFISDRNHEEWLRKFLETYEIQKEIPFANGGSGEFEEIPF